MLLHGSILTIILNQKKLHKRNIRALKIALKSLLKVLTITESYCDHYLYNIKIQVSHY